MVSSTLSLDKTGVAETGVTATATRLPTAMTFVNGDAIILSLPGWSGTGNFVRL